MIIMIPLRISYSVKVSHNLWITNLLDLDSILRRISQSMPSILTNYNNINCISGIFNYSPVTPSSNLSRLLFLNT